MHGFQLWVNLRARDKMIAPRYQGFEGESSAVARHAGWQPVAGHRRRRSLVSSGRSTRRRPVTYAHVTVAAGDAIEWDVPDGYTALVHVFVGSVDVNGTIAEEGQLVELEHDGGGVVVQQ